MESSSRGRSEDAGYVLVAVSARIARADGSVEQITLDHEAYLNGKFDPAPTLANGDSLSILTEYA